VSDLFQTLKVEFQDEDYRYAYAESFLNTKIAAQIKTLREQREQTQAQLAAKMGIKQPGYRRFEDINHSVWKTDSLWMIARALGVRLNISFETFGTLPEEKKKFNKESLQRPEFKDDPAFTEHGEQQESNAAALARSILEQRVTSQGESRYSLAGPIPAEGVPVWESRLDLASHIMELNKQFPQLFKSLAGAQKVTVRSAPEDRYKGMGLVPPPSKPIQAITPKQSQRNVQWGPLQTVDLNPEGKEVA